MGRAWRRLEALDVRSLGIGAVGGGDIRVGTVGLLSEAGPDQEREGLASPQAEFVVSAKGDEGALQEQQRGWEIGLHGLPPRRFRTRLGRRSQIKRSLI